MTFDNVYDVRGLKIGVSDLLEHGRFQNPLITPRLGRKHPENLGMGCVKVRDGSYADFVTFLEKHAQVRCAAVS